MGARGILQAAAGGGASATGRGAFFASLAPSHGPRPGVVGRRRGRPCPPRASVVAAPPVVEAVLGAFLPASPRCRRGGRRRPWGEKVCGRPRQSENGRPGGIARGRPQRDKDGRPPGGSWRRLHATGRGVRAAAAKQRRPAATVRGRRRNKGPAAPGGSYAAGHGGRRYAAGRGGVRTAGRGGDPAGRAGGTAATEWGRPAAGGSHIADRSGTKSAGRGGERQQ